VCYTGKDKSKTAAQYEHCDEILKEKTAHLGIHVTREDIIHSFDNAKGTNGSMQFLPPACRWSWLRWSFRSLPDWYMY